MSTSIKNYVTFYDGTKVPALGLGTWQSKKGEVANAVKVALDAGYRHIDCARVYENEDEVGEALAAWLGQPGHKRSDLFVTGKLWNTHHHEADVPRALEQTLKDLQLDYIDQYLIHWPLAFELTDGQELMPRDASGNIRLDMDCPIRETWQAMEKLVDAGKVKHIGISNFTATKIKDLLTYARIKPAVLQVELHPYLPQHELLQFCREHKIAVTAYSPLGSTPSDPSKPDAPPHLLKDETLNRIAKKYSGKTAGHIAIAWALRRGTMCIPKSVHDERIRSNFEADALAGELSADDVKEIDGLAAASGKTYRFVDPKGFWGVNIFED